MIGKILRNIIIFLIVFFIVLYISDKELALNLLNGIKEFCLNILGGFKYLL